MKATRWTGDVILYVLWNLALKLGSKKGPEPALKVRPAPIHKISELYEVKNHTPRDWLDYWLRENGLLSQRFRLLLYKQDGDFIAEWEGFGQNVSLPVQEDEVYHLYVGEPAPEIEQWMEILRRDDTYPVNLQEPTSEELESNQRRLAEMLYTNRE